MRRSLTTALAAALLLSPLAAHAVEPPLPPKVDDPMLAPVVAAKTNVSTWEDALKHVKARSIDLRIALQEVTRAEGLSRVALAGALPTISGNVTYTHNLITNDGAQFTGIGPAGPVVRPVQVPFPDFFTGTATLNQPLLALRAWYNIGTRSVAEDAARLSVEDAKRAIALGVANAIVATVTAERIAELNRNGLRNALTRVEITQRKMTLGSATGLDLVRARQDVENARATLVAGDESLRQAREALGLALGLPEQVGVPPSVKLDGLAASAQIACKPVKSIEERPDVAALKVQAEVARRGITDVKLGYLPTVNFVSNVNTTTLNTGAAPNTTWNIQAVLSVPIWDGGARYGNQRAAEAAELQALEKVEATRRQAAIQLAQAQRGVAVADERRNVALETRKLADETDRLTRAAFAEGRGTSLELVTAAQALRDAEIQLAVREFELVKARLVAVLALASCNY